MDGNTLNVRVFHPLVPTNDNVLLPTIVYLHGGGMGFYNIDTYHNYYRALSTLGLVVVAVNFRNSVEAPFPAGLHDCLSAVMWTYTNALSLKIDRHMLVVGGESGGANLTAATCLLAKEKGIDIIKGQYLNCPYFLALSRYPSRQNYDKYVLSNAAMEHHSGRAYTEPSEFATNYLAWPGNASVEQLRGMPPTLIVTNEFDPLVDEGEAHARKLMQAGVKVVALRVIGTTHGACLIRAFLPDVFYAVHGALKSWIAGLNQASKL